MTENQRIEGIRRDTQDLSHADLVANADKWKARFDNILRALVVVVVIAALATTYFTIATLGKVQTLTEQNVELNKLSVSNGDLIVDCTTPGGGCYERSRAETGKVVLNLNQVTKAAVICADQPGVITASAMESCITTEIKKQGAAQ